MTKTAIICDRVSSDEQAAIGRSIEDRNAQMLTYATANGMTVIDTLVDDITGKILIGDRPKGKRILEYIDTRRCDSVIWFDVDRVGRDEDALSLSALRRRCRDAGVELHFAKTGKCDLESMSAVLDYFKALAAADERRKIIERTHGGRKVKARRGQLVGCGTVGYGFRKVGSGKTVTVEIDQNEAHVIRRARDLILGRGGLIPMSVQAVCALFDSERIDIPIKARRKKPEIKFDYWHGESLSGILRNPAITGHFIYSDIEIDKPELAIISPEDQAALDVRIRANKLNSKGARRKDYLMAKRLTCVCGRHYSGATFNLRGYERRYYRCTQTAVARSARTCSEPFLRVDSVDTEAWDWICKLITDTAGLCDAVRLFQVKTAEDQQPKIERIVALKHQIAVEGVRLKRFIQRLGDVEDSEMPQLLASMAECRKNVRTWTADLGTLERALAEQPTVSEADIMQMAETFQQLIVGADFATRRYIVERFDVRGQVIHTPEGRSIRFTCGLLEVANNMSRMSGSSCTTTLPRPCR